jgi:hypothetical protein
MLSLEALKHQLDYMALKEAAAKAAAAGAAKPAAVAAGTDGATPAADAPPAGA